MGGRKQLDEGKDGHTDDVTALCLSTDRKLVATGQNGQKPLVLIWDAHNAQVIAKKRLPKGSRLVTGIGFSKSGTYLAASDAAEKITVHIFKMNGESANPCCNVQINMKIVHLAFSPHTEELFATAGKDHVAICTISGNSVTKKVGKSKGGKIESQCSAAWINSTSHKNVLLSGGSDG